jgi:hypothetical protein
MSIGGDNMNHIKVNLDSRKRIPLTKILKDCEAKTFDMYWENDRIILVPLIEIPEREAWIYKNKKALASLEKGLRDAAEGKVRKLDLSTLPEIDEDE